MSDTTEFWRDVRAMIKEEIANALQPMTGLTPGHYNGLTVDKFGRITFAASTSSIYSIACTKNNTPQTIPNDTDTPITFNQRLYPASPPSGWPFAFTLNGSSITINRDGYYLMFGGVKWEDATTGYRRLMIKRGVNYYGITQGSQEYQTHAVAADVYSGETVHLAVRQDSGGDVDVEQNTYETYLVVVGPLFANLT